MANLNYGAIAPLLETNEEAQQNDEAMENFRMELEQATEVTVRDDSSVENLVMQLEGVENAVEVAHDLVHVMSLYHGLAEGSSVSHLRGLQMANGGGVRQYHIRFCT
jgi:hypothetical protein